MGDGGWGRGDGRCRVADVQIRRFEQKRDSDLKQGQSRSWTISITGARSGIRYVVDPSSSRRTPDHGHPALFRFVRLGGPAVVHLTIAVQPGTGY